MPTQIPTHSIKFNRPVMLLVGSPCSGKTYFLKRNFRRGDLLLDVDALKTAFAQVMTHADVHPAILHLAIETKNFLLGSLKQSYPPKIGRAWVTTTNPEPEQRDEFRKAGAEIICLDTPYETCIERLYAAPDNRDRQTIMPIIKNYFAEFQLGNGDRSISSGDIL